MSNNALETSRRELILAVTHAKSVLHEEKIQTLWSGYGELLRYRLQGASMDSVILKDIDLSGGGGHPRHWNTDAGHQRKLHSYEVEASWYQNHASRCGQHCRVPACLSATRSNQRVRLILEDLDTAGFPDRVRHAGLNEARVGLQWLAAFHATFLGTHADDLWPVGTYWHLSTRTEEWSRLPDSPLKEAAHQIDARLNAARHQTLVHGDAKLENFCFSPDRSTAAAVDFQYVGHGCGIKDVAYFISSVFGEDDCERHESDLLDCYFHALRSRMPDTIDADDLEREWRGLYPVAWTDFHRFLLGWSPGHWKIHRYSERLTRETLSQLNQQPL